jgi:hypothetical protein
MKSAQQAHLLTTSFKPNHKIGKEDRGANNANSRAARLV